MNSCPADYTCSVLSVVSCSGLDFVAGGGFFFFGDRGGGGGGVHSGEWLAVEGGWMGYRWWEYNYSEGSGDSFSTSPSFILLLLLFLSWKRETAVFS